MAQLVVLFPKNLFLLFLLLLLSIFLLDEFQFRLGIRVFWIVTVYLFENVACCKVCTILKILLRSFKIGLDFSVLLAYWLRTRIRGCATALVVRNTDQCSN